MVRIVFFGDKLNKRLGVLNTIDNVIIDIISGINENTILNNLPNGVIDLFIVDKTNYNYKNIPTTIKSNVSISHIPIISLISKNDVKNNIINDDDLFISDSVSNLEFKYYVKTMLKMKLMDDELKKEKIILELKVKERTLELENKAERLNITLNSIGDGVIVTNYNGYITSMNPVAECLCRMEKDEYKSKKIDDIFNIYVEGKEINIFEIVKKTKKIQNLPIDSLLISSSKEKIRISDSASPMINKKGEFTGMVLVFHDITEEYELRKNILNSERQYKRIYENVPDIIYTHDLNGNILTVNNNVKQIGYDPKEIIGKNISILLDNDNMDKAHRAIQDKLDKPDLITKYNIDVITKTKEIKTFEIKSHLIKDDNDNIEVFAIARDVTDFIESQEIIRSEQERYRNIFDNMKSGVSVFKTIDNGETFIFSDCNSSCEKIENVKRENVINKRIDYVFDGIKDTNFINDLKEVYKTGVSKFSDIFYYENNLSGVKGWRENFIYKLKSSDEVVAIYDDVTDRMEYQEKLREAKDKAEESDRLKSIFISNISHEIRTPMNAIIGFSNMIPNEESKKKVSEYIEIITKSGNLLLSLINDILDLSKIESGSSIIKKSEVELFKLMKDLKTQFRIELKNRNKSNIKIIISGNKKEKIYTDSKKLNQILMNLITNSIKFTEKGYIEIGYNIKKSFVHFYVKDTGIGIKEDKLDVVFDRFNQVDRQNIRKQEGTGLGLTICKATVELLGGKIWIDSEYGNGTTVYFTIPYEKMELNSTVDETISNISTPKKEISNKNVLVIEDDDTNYELLKAILLSKNMNIDRCINHLEFFDKIESDELKYDLILLDIQLPNYDGLDILKWLRNNNINIPVIVQTAYAYPEYEIKSKELGSDGFITKPIIPTKLLSLINSIFYNE